MAERDLAKGMQEYIDALERGESDHYSPDFIEGFKHAWRMVQAFGIAWSPSEGTAKPEVREAAREALKLMEKP